MSDISINYKNSEIANTSTSGTLIINTAGSYCEDDIDIIYTKPVGGGTITEDGNGDIEIGETGNVDKITTSNDVNFFDYDGTIIASYSASDFANLTEMPANPSHSGLTAQGWNWSLADAKTQVALSGFLDIGQMYITNDGKTRIYISLYSNKLLSPRLYWIQSDSEGVTIDWGDGTSTTQVSGTGNKFANHTYSSIGNYVITLNVTSGTVKLGNGSSGTNTIYGLYNGPAYRACVTKVNIGGNITELSAYCFYQSANLSAISIPNTITTIGNYAFTVCQFPYVTVPSSCTSIGTNVFDSCKAMQYISIPKSALAFGTNELYSCTGLLRILLYGITSIGSNAFAYNYGTSIIWFGSSLSSIGDNAFRSMIGCIEFHFTSTTPPTLGTTPFNGIQSVANTKIYVPAASLSTYQTAWSDYSSYLVGE